MPYTSLKQTVRNYIWKMANNLRNPHPAPRRAVPFDESFTEVGVTLCWRGDEPPPQEITHPWKTLRVGTLAFFRPFVLSLENGQVIGKRGDVITARGTIFTNVSPEIPRRPDHHFLLERGRMPQYRYIDDSVIVLNCGPYRNYFHFLFEAIGRLQFFQQAGVQARYYCVAHDTRFQRELLTQFGIREEQIIPLEKGTHVAARELLIASLPGYNCVAEQVHLKDINTFQHVRRAILNHITATPEKYASAIYIQRRQRRCLAHEAELLTSFPQSEDWQTVALEEHSVLEQAAIFYHARTIVAVHGAGLANLVYSQPGTHVVEIFGPDLIEPAYLQIALLFDLHYQPVMGEYVDDTHQEYDGNKTIRVNPKDIF